MPRGGCGSVVHRREPSAAKWRDVSMSIKRQHSRVKALATMFVLFAATVANAVAPAGASSAYEQERIPHAQILDLSTPRMGRRVSSEVSRTQLVAWLLLVPMCADVQITLRRGPSISSTLS
jgi:hypothetical protein